MSISPSGGLTATSSATLGSIDWATPLYAAVFLRELLAEFEPDFTYSSFRILPSALRLLNFLIMRSATLFSVNTISKVTAGCDFARLQEIRQLVPLESKRSECNADSMSASVVPGAKLEA